MTTRFENWCGFLDFYQNLSRLFLPISYNLWLYWFTARRYHTRKCMALFNTVIQVDKIDRRTLPLPWIFMRSSCVYYWKQIWFQQTSRVSKCPTLQPMICNMLFNSQLSVFFDRLRLQWNLPRITCVNKPG